MKRASHRSNVSGSTTSSNSSLSLPTDASSDSSSPSLPSSAFSSSGGSFKATATSAQNYHNTLSQQLANLEVGVEFKLDLRSEDLANVNELGHGNGGTVTLVRHIPTGAIMAKKVGCVCGVSHSCGGIWAYISAPGLSRDS